MVRCGNRGVLGIVMMLWLVLAPALSAVHAAEHDHAVPSDELSCVLCHLGDRDDAGVVPDRPVIHAPAYAPARERPLEAPRRGRAVVAPAIRGPPLQG